MGKVEEKVIRSMSINELEIAASSHFQAALNTDNSELGKRHMDKALKLKTESLTRELRRETLIKGSGIKK